MIIEKLSNNEVHIFCYNTEKLAYSLDINKFCVKEDFFRASRMNDLKRKQIFLLSRAILRKLLTRYLKNYADNFECKYSYDRIHLNYSPYGKPFVNNLPIKFNISHSRDQLIIVFSLHEIGADIEYLEKKLYTPSERFLTGMRKRFFGIEYCSEISDKMLIKLWAIKEAAVKLFGSSVFVFDGDFFINSKAKIFKIDDVIKHKSSLIIDCKYNLAKVIYKNNTGLVFGFVLFNDYLITISVNKLTMPGIVIR